MAAKCREILPKAPPPHRVTKDIAPAVLFSGGSSGVGKNALKKRQECVKLELKHTNNLKMTKTTNKNCTTPKKPQRISKCKIPENSKKSDKWVINIKAAISSVQTVCARHTESPWGCPTVLIGGGPTEHRRRGRQCKALRHGTARHITRQELPVRERDASRPSSDFVGLLPALGPADSAGDDREVSGDGAGVGRRPSTVATGVWKSRLGWGGVEAASVRGRPAGFVISCRVLGGWSNPAAAGPISGRGQGGSQHLCQTALSPRGWLDGPGVLEKSPCHPLIFIRQRGKETFVDPKMI